MISSVIVTSVEEMRHDPFPININLLLIFFGILFLTSIIIFIIRIRQKKPAKLTIIGIIITGVILLTIMISCLVGMQHGLYTTNLTLYQLYHSIDNTPIEDKLPDNLSGAIILFYRFGCTDCEAIYNDLAEYVTDADNVYWVSTRSKQGQELRAKYPIESVPTGIYISKDTDDETPVFTKKTLDTKTSDGLVILNTDAIDRLLYLQEQNR